MGIVDTLKASFSGLVNGLLSQSTAKKVTDTSPQLSGFDVVCRRAAAEGIVMLENNGVLPLTRGTAVSLFGRTAWDYFYIGYGSGGDVCTQLKCNLPDSIRKDGTLVLNETLCRIYEEWRVGSPADDGFWGHWPLAHREMPLTDEVVRAAAAVSDTAIITIGRAAGEDRESSLSEGSYYLTAEEREMLARVTSVFSRCVLVLDCGNNMDLSWIPEYPLSAVLLAWQGGQESCRALTDILTGRVSPSAKLTDTVAWKYEDYPSSANFGKPSFNNYAEDIYVGYRYFATFAPERVQYPFGFGLSYSQFSLSTTDFAFNGESVSISVAVRAQGAIPSQEVVQVYVSAPTGNLGKPQIVLADFAKTASLGDGEESTIDFCIPTSAFASYDDSGSSGHRSCFVLESGEYTVYIGNSSTNIEVAGSFTIDTTCVVERCTEAMAPQEKHAFDRLTAVRDTEGHIVPKYEKVPTRTVSLRERILENMPAELPRVACGTLTFEQVVAGEVTPEDFVASLSPSQLISMAHGEGGMGSKLGADGNAGAFGGVTPSLREVGVPPIITTDGPSGIRLAAYTTMMPCGTCLASSFNTALVTELAATEGREMKLKHSDVLLAPGMNIHRSPLCGRNFEYYSEDPLVSGKIAAAYVTGVQSEGRIACPKHFACNSQETKRTRTDSRVSERALREIYLRGFEYCVKASHPLAIMTSYNKINGVWSHYNYELCTTVLRGEWGFDNMVMTDWWMQKSPSPEFSDCTNNAYRVRAQVDVLMPGGKSHTSAKRDNSLDKAFKHGGITIAELQRTALNVLKLCLHVARTEK